MIGFLKGVVHSVSEEVLILETHGIGYRVFSPSNVLSNAQIGEELSLSIHTHVREDAITLFGFEKEEHLTFFRQLISVSGIGPKLALGILGGSSDLVKQAVIDGDEAVLTRLPGIGKKTAGRIILDLKGKISAPASSPRAVRTDSLDAAEALANLGYDRGMVQRVLDDLPSEISTTEDIVKYFLQNA